MISKAWQNEKADLEQQEDVHTQIHPIRYTSEVMCNKLVTAVSSAVTREAPCSNYFAMCIYIF